MCDDISLLVKKENVLEEINGEIPFPVVGVDCFKDTTCQLCFKSFSFKKQLIKHYEAVHADEYPFTCPCNYKSFKSYSGLKKHKRICGKREGCHHLCQYCSKHFFSVEKLDNHYHQDHLRALPYKCDCCDKGFKTFRSFRKHCLSKARGKVFECLICGKTFAQQYNLAAHTKRMHCDEKPFVCKYCEKGFVEKASLTIHTRFHTGEKPFKCKQCSSSFCDSSGLRVHMHKHSEERKYSCDLCEKQYKRRSSLLHHKISHHFKENDRGCPICGLKFKRQEYWKKHVKDHFCQ